MSIDPLVRPALLLDGHPGGLPLLAGTAEVGCVACSRGYAAAWRAGLLSMPLRAPQRVVCRGCRQGKAQVCCPSDWGSEDRGSGGEGGTRGAAERLGRDDHHRRPEDAGSGHGG